MIPNDHIYVGMFSPVQTHIAHGSSALVPGEGWKFNQWLDPPFHSLISNYIIMAPMEMSWNVLSCGWEILS